MSDVALGAEQPHTVTTADGVALRAWLASPPDPRGVMLLCHGLTTNADEHGAFPALRDRALRAGLAIARFDFRGHGHSGGNNEGLRLIGLRTDVEAVLELIDREIPGRPPLIPIGLSFGGGAAVHAAVVRPPCAGLALWYAVVDYQSNYGVDSTVPFTRQMRAAVAPGSDPPWAEMPLLGTEWYFPKALMAEMPADNTLAGLSDLRVPVLAYHGSRDPFVDIAPIRRLSTQRANIELRIAHGAGHGFLLWRPWIIRRTVMWAQTVAQAACAATPSAHRRPRARGRR